MTRLFTKNNEATNELADIVSERFRELVDRFINNHPDISTRDLELVATNAIGDRCAEIRLQRALRKAR